MRWSNRLRLPWAWIGCGSIVGGNLVLAGLLYETAGWYYLRGYNEVVNFVVVPLACALAGVNLLMAVPIAVVGRWRNSRGGRVAMASLVGSAAFVALSPLFAPHVGRFAARRLWIKTPIVEAARYGDAKLVVILLAHGANPSEQEHALGTAPLHYMVACDELAAVEVLLAKGADPNAPARTSLETPLHWAVESRASMRVISALAQAGADPTLRDWHGNSPADYAETLEDPQRMAVLIAMGLPGTEKVGDSGIKP